MSLPIADESQPPRKFNKWVRDAGPVPFVEVLITVRHRTIPGRFGVMTGYMTHEKEWRCSQWVGWVNCHHLRPIVRRSAPAL